MAKSFYTFIIVPNASSRLHKLKLPIEALYLLGAIGLISFFVAVGLGFSYAKLAFKAADYDKLQAENIDLKVQKKNLQVVTSKLGTKLEILETRSEQLQNLIEKDSFIKRGTVNVPAIGGSSVDYRTSDLIGANLKAGVERLKDRTTDLETTMGILEQKAVKEASIRRYTPNIWPVRGHITSHWGRRRDPFTGDAELHLGVDIAALFGTRVHAPADGIVLYAQKKSAYGNLVILDHGNGVTTRHGHLSAISVKVGQKVKRNDVLGAVGMTGRTTAPHLHYEVRENDRARNPKVYLPRS
ncbi:MAG TPA: M23 family metallopeptidase [Bdellovibrionota bacterium]|nr:M23 family metallopeptidase [Bdellovibrionota bacterium]